MHGFICSPVNTCSFCLHVAEPQILWPARPKSDPTRLHHRESALITHTAILILTICSLHPFTETACLSIYAQLRLGQNNNYTSNQSERIRKKEGDKKNNATRATPTFAINFVHGLCGSSWNCRSSIYELILSFDCKLGSLLSQITSKGLELPSECWCFSGWPYFRSRPSLNINAIKR